MFDPIFSFRIAWYWMNKVYYHFLLKKKILIKKTRILNNLWIEKKNPINSQRKMLKPQIFLETAIYEWLLVNKKNDINDVHTWEKIRIFVINNL